MRDPERVRVAVEVEARDRGEPDPVVEDGPGLPGEDLDAVAELDELARDVPRVDALAPATGVAAVDEEGDPEARQDRAELRLQATGGGMWRLRSQDSRRSFQRCLGDLRNRGPGGECHQHDRPASPGPPAGRKRALGPPLTPVRPRAPGATFVSDGPDLPARGRGIPCRDPCLARGEPPRGMG